MPRASAPRGSAAGERLDRRCEILRIVHGPPEQVSCPFHAGSYGANGQLVAIPRLDHFGDVDPRCNDLVELPACERHGILIANPDPDGAIPSDLFSGLDTELASWGLDRAAHIETVTYRHAMNWKLAIDTYGETYHFNALHRDTLAAEYHGNVQTYDTYGSHHRMALCLKGVDRLRSQPEEQWDILLAGTPVYFLFPNTQLLVTAGGPVVAQIYPNGADPHHSHTRLSFYTNADLDGIALSDDAKARVADLGRRLTRFAEVIRDEDYAVAATAQISARSGALPYVTFGRNEPALHHYHNQFRKALGRCPLPTTPPDARTGAGAARG